MSSAENRLDELESHLDAAHKRIDYLEGGTSKDRVVASRLAQMVAIRLSSMSFWKVTE